MGGRPRPTPHLSTPTSNERVRDQPALALTPPAAIPAVMPEQAEAGVGLARETVARIDVLVADFIEAIIRLDPHSAEFGRRIGELNRIAEREIFATSAMSARLLDRPAQAVSWVLAAKAPIARNLLDLRRLVEALDPVRRHLGPADSSGWERYLEDYTNAQSRLQEITWALTSSRDRLLADNAALGQEERALWTEVETLRQYAHLVHGLDDGLQRRIDGLAASDPDRCRILESDVLFPVRQRLQAILTQLAVAVQGDAALRIVQQNNQELIRAINAATTTTTAALRTAVMVAQAVAAQRLILDGLRTVGRDANRDGPGDTTVLAEITALRGAWGQVLGTLDEIDAYSAAARLAMKATLRELTGQVERSRMASGDLETRQPIEPSTLRI
jgi:uncharacterized protein YaaN involved in tellurite resistance